MPEPLLKVENLKVSFKIKKQKTAAVEDVNFSLDEGKIIGIVGESGCGKSVTATSILRLMPPSLCEIDENSKILFQGKDLSKASNAEMRDVRGNKISMIFQEPMTSLNPVYTIGYQMVEMLQTHQKISKHDAMQKSIEMLEKVGIPSPEQRIKEYPHQLSGGMRQRVMIAMALSCNPKLLIADEPTTALDVTIQAQLLDLLKGLREKFGMSIILVTHDLGVVADFADRIQVMYAGRVVERGTKGEIFRSPKHPYTWALLDSIPSRSLPRKSRLYSLKGTPPNLSLPIEGCPFAARCRYCMPVCRKCAPQPTDFSSTHQASCWLNHPMAPQHVREGGSR